ncbi:MAG: 4Fe-4S dicluster domain-containing protein, partial [Planctomycetes bacterium]|nr:4Fe-4S dicluster domain-containing protein [Planctomycetota bacterium]
MPDRETLEVDVLFVGAGPASLAGAYHLARLARDRGAGRTEPSIAVLEKGSAVGLLSFSGGVMDPRALRELIPDFEARGAPLGERVTEDRVMLLTPRQAVPFPVTPPAFRNHGNYVVSLSQLTPWLAQQAEALGVQIFSGFSGTDLLYDAERVLGVRTGDKGIDKHGNPKPNHEPGIDIRSKVTVLGEGPRGSLTKQHVRRLRLDEGRSPEAYATGVKEVWRIPEGAFGAGRVVHTLGYPSDLSSRAGIAGGWLYGLSPTHLSIGYVVWLNYRDPFLNPHADFQRFKTHPWVAALLEGGEIVEYGAKAVPEGGWHTIPRLVSDGCCLVGDAAQMVNGQRLKGIHLAMKSGMLAAEAILPCLESGDVSANALEAYPRAFQRSWAGRELYRTRNFHGAFEGGFWSGAVRSEIQRLLGGADPFGSPAFEADPDALMTASAFHGEGARGPSPPHADGRRTFSKVDSVFRSGTRHEEDQPAHLLVADWDLCRSRCAAEFGNPCVRFCPANVYEMEPESGGARLQLNPSNCVHCKTCDIKDP